MAVLGWIFCRGFPRNERRNHTVVVLQAFADDSGSAPNSEFFSVAGWVAPRETWDAFSPVWRDVCLEPRKISFFKSNHAIGFKKQFQGFTQEQRNAKVARLAGTIAEFSPLRIGASLRRSDYLEAFRSGFEDVASKEPYYILATHICAECHVLLEKSNGQLDRVDFFFDFQGKLGYRFKKYYEKTIKPQCPGLGECNFVDDITFTPLQAADMVAWRARQDSMTVDMWTAADVYLAPMMRPIQVMSRSLLLEMAQNIKRDAGLGC
jgi:hypothetical protein